MVIPKWSQLNSSVDITLNNDNDVIRFIREEKREKLKYELKEERLKKLKKLNE